MPTQRATAPAGLDELEAARAHLVSLRERLGAGEAVTTAELTAAEDEVHVHELRAEAAADFAARAAERRRLERIEEIRRSLTAGDLERQAAAIVEAFDRTAAAAADLYRAKSAYERNVKAILVELNGLRPLPAGMLLSGSGGAIHMAATIDGRTWRAGDRTNVDIVAEAAAIGIEAAGASRGDLHKVVGATSPVDRLRRLIRAGDAAGNAGDEPKDAA